MNDRLQNFENLITGPDGSINDIFSERQRESNQIQQLLSLTAQQSYQLSKDIENQHNSLKSGIEIMRKEFSESIQQVLKDKPDPTKQNEYKNVLPYGLEKAEPNPNRGPPTSLPDVNISLENLDPSLTKNTHSIYTKIYHRMFPDTYTELKESMFENYGDSSVTDIDKECLNHIFSSAVGSMFDWTSIDPKSVGMGSIEHLTELFQTYYFGEVDDTTATPWKEKRSDNRKYVNGDKLEIQGDRFYNDFINGFFFRSCAKGYLSKEKKAPKDFNSEIDGFYDFNPDLWFDNKDPNNSQKFKPEDNHDSYGNFFKVKQPVRIREASHVDGAGANQDARYARNYPAAHSWNTAVTNADGQIDNYTGMYKTNLANAADNYILTEEEKMVCCLFHYASMRNQEFVPGATIVSRVTSTNRTLELLDFNSTQTNRSFLGNGTDRGPDGAGAGNALRGQNENINKVIQFLYNSQSIGFHKTHQNVDAALANSSTLIIAGGKQDIQMITGFSCGVETAGAGVNRVYVSNTHAAQCQVSNGDGATAAGIPAHSTPLFTVGVAGGPTVAEVSDAFSRNQYQYVLISTLMKGGRSKNQKKISKTISKKKLPEKEKKINPVRKVKKIKKQTGGARGNLFDIISGHPNGQADISLSALRRDEKITKTIFENYRKAIKEYIKKFGKGASQTKIDTDIIAKIDNIYHFGMFYHSLNRNLNFGGNSVGNTGPSNEISFEQLGEIFLFCSVITNTIKLMIHFFNNIKACINHFITSDLEDIKKSINTQLKSVNTTNISSLNASYFDKYIDGCNELIKNINNLVDFLRNNTMNLGKPITSGNAAGVYLLEDEQLIINLFFGANIKYQGGTKAAPLGVRANSLDRMYPSEYYKFHHELIDFFSINSKNDFKRINSTKFQRTLRKLTSYDVILNNGFIAHTNPHVYPKKDYSITNASFGGIPFTFHEHKATHYSWMTYMFLLIYREKSNEKLTDEVIGEINQSLSQISSQDKSDIKKKVIDTYKGIRPIIADPKIDLGTKNKILQKVFYSFFEDSNTVAKKIIEDHSAIEKKSKRTNIRGKITITDIVQRRHLRALETGRLLIPNEIKIQQEMRKFSYKVDCLINALHNMLISKTQPSIKNYIIFMYSISRLRNFVYRLYYLNKTYYMENETTKKLLLLESGFDLSKNSKTPDKKKTFDLFNKLNSSQLKDQNSDTEEWWNVMEQSFRKQTTEVHGKYFRLFAYVLMDGEVFLVDIFSMAKSTHSVKSDSEIMKKDIKIYKDHNGDDIYSPDNMFIKLVTDFTKDSNYKKLLNGELHYEYTKQGSGTKKNKILEPLFIQGSTINQLNNIINDNHYVAPSGGRPSTFVLSTKPDTSFQIYKIQKHSILNAHSFRSWAYNLIFSMPTRIDVDDSYFKLHIQTPVFTIPSLAKSQLLISLSKISKLNQREPIVEFQSKVRINNNAKLLMNNNIRNKDIDSYVRYISREQIILLGLVFGDSLH